jgi:hypothetical protein
MKQQQEQQLQQQQQQRQLSRQLVAMSKRHSLLQVGSWCENVLHLGL